MNTIVDTYAWNPFQWMELIHLIISVFEKFYHGPNPMLATSGTVLLAFLVARVLWHSLPAVFGYTGHALYRAATLMDQAIGLHKVIDERVRRGIEKVKDWFSRHR